MPLLNDAQRHHRVYFPRGIIFRAGVPVLNDLPAPVNVIGRFANDCDYMRLTKFELIGRFSKERKALRRPTENSLPNFAPLRANRNFSAYGLARNKR